MMNLRDRILETFLRNRVCAGRNIRISGQCVSQAIWDGLYRESLIPEQSQGTGSFFEGLPDEVCNDADVMIIHKDNPVVVHQQPDVAPPQRFLIYDINPSNPAYLSLRTVPGVEYNTYIQDSIQQSSNHGYLSSSRFVADAFHGNEGIQETHGPAVVGMLDSARPELGTMDNVYCLSCLSWPPCASEFLTRPRHHGWPPQSLIDKIQQYGCHVVPVGHPQSENKDIEWRLSFSIAERELLRNINDKMFMVMYALKAIKNKHWRQDGLDVTIFCSYFIKTACLWVGEETDQSNISMMDLCRKVVDWLVTCCRTHKLPHYFIPGQNLIGHLEEDLCNVASSWLLKTKQRLDTDTITPLCMDQSLEAGYLRLLKLPNFNDVLLSILDTYIKKYVNIANFKEMRNAEIYITGASDGSVQEAVKAGMVPSYIAHVLEKVFISIISDLPNIVKPGREQTFRTLLYRKLGDHYQSLMFYSTKIANLNISSIIPSLSGLSPEYHGFYILCFEVYKSIIVGSGSLYYDKTIDYYTQGLELVYPDGWSDRGMGGYVRLATFYHLNGEREKLGQTLEKLEPVLDWGRKNDVNRIVGIIYIVKRRSLSTLPWKQDQELYTNVIKSCDDLCVRINPVVLGYYLLIRWLLDDKSQEEQTSETRHKIQEYISYIETTVTGRLVLEQESAERILQILRNIN